VRLLEIRGVDKRWRLPCEPVMLDVADHADNFSRSIFFGGVGIEAQPQLFADRILVREVTMYEGFIDHDGPRRSAGIVIVQKASFLQRDSERVEEAGADLVVSSPRPLIGRWSGMPENRESVPF